MSDCLGVSDRAALRMVQIMVIHQLAAIQVVIAAWEVELLDPCLGDSPGVNWHAVVQRWITRASKVRCR